MKPTETDNMTSQANSNNKPTNIQNQYNTNCQQFFAPIYGATFTMPATTPPQPTETPSDQNIRAAIEALYEETMGDGQKLFTNQSQWYAVYRVLGEFCNYPTKMTDFVQAITDKGFAVTAPLCNYNSIKKASGTCPLLSCKLSLWKQYEDKSSAYEKMCRVADFLLEKLGFAE